MVGPIENKSSTTRPLEHANVQLDLVPLDLLTPLDEERPDRAVTESSDMANAAARLRAETVPSLQSAGSSAEARPQPPATAPQGPRLERVPTVAIRPAATMPRQRLESSDFAALTASIKRNGLAQPLFVRILSNEPKLYELFAGYRRWRAALAAKIDYVPVIVFGHLNDVVALELNLLENLSRRDLSIIEEAEAFRVLVERYGRTPAQIAALSGRTLNQVTNMLCLVALPEEVRLRLRKGQISFEHGRALIGVADSTSLARRIVEEGLTVRETELLAAQRRSTSASTEGTSTQSESGSEPTDSAPSIPGSTVAPAEKRVPNDLRILQAALRTTVSAEIEVRLDRDDSVLLIGGRSTQDTANVVSALCDAMRLLRTNRMISAASQKIRAA